MPCRFFRASLEGRGEVESCSSSLSQYFPFSWFVVLRCEAHLEHVPMLIFGTAQFCSAGATLIIQPIPNRSSSIPKRGDQNVFVSGILIFAPSANALKALSASASLE